MSLSLLGHGKCPHWLQRSHEMHRYAHHLCLACLPAFCLSDEPFALPLIVRLRPAQQRLDPHPANARLGRAGGQRTAPRPFLMKTHRQLGHALCIRSVEWRKRQRHCELPPLSLTLLWDLLPGTAYPASRATDRAR
ncbi:hypothetical protein J7T55_010103 [Diaporthe amygdali]|uniref:uncharacterized protein n=1 Tax=Phomopsis amygdali TaxID=1214568 RepID=UPI0022FEE0F1|nr:uncharacterized protein J7T55_010103 [Diaporthe amygdali]KAJ0113859.1 hypothetical protein J7T55_010103 [Diaporthe amygdali]